MIWSANVLWREENVKEKAATAVAEYPQACKLFLRRPDINIDWQVRNASISIM